MSVSVSVHACACVEGLDVYRLVDKVDRIALSWKNSLPLTSATLDASSTEPLSLGTPRASLEHPGDDDDDDDDDESYDKDNDELEAVVEDGKTIFSDEQTIYDDAELKEVVEDGTRTIADEETIENEPSLPDLLDDDKAEDQLETEYQREVKSTLPPDLMYTDDQEDQDSVQDKPSHPDLLDEDSPA